MMKKTETPMSYKILLTGERKVVISLPCSLEQLNKRDRTKFELEVKKVLLAVVNKSKLEAQAAYDVHLREAELLKERFNL